MTGLPLYVRMVKDMQQLLDVEPDDSKRAASIILLMVTFAMYYARDDTGLAREVLDGMHEKSLELLLAFENGEGRPLAS